MGSLGMVVAANPVVVGESGVGEELEVVVGPEKGVQGRDYPGLAD